MTKKNELISVIVPVYNVENFLDKCVKSIINQSYKNLQIILVDDGSTDKSGEICDKYSSKDNRITVIHKKNGGLSDARNKGIEVAIGEYISFVDSDDWIEQDLYETCMKHIGNCDIVCFSMQLDYSNGVHKVKKIPRKIILDNDQGIRYLNSYKNIDVSACNKLFRRKLFDNIRFPYKKLCEDCYIMYKLFLKAKNILILPYIGYHYYKRVGSISNSNKINMDYIYAYKEQMNYFNSYLKKYSILGESSYAYANLAMFNYVIHNIGNKTEIKAFRNEARKYSRSVYKNKDLPIKKKVQFYIFNRFNLIYRLVYKIRR